MSTPQQNFAVDQATDAIATVAVAQYKMLVDALGSREAACMCLHMILATNIIQLLMKDPTMLGGDGHIDPCKMVDRIGEMSVGCLATSIVHQDDEEVTN